MATRIGIHRALAQRLGRGKLSAITGTNSSNVNTTLIDATQLAYSSGDANAYDRVFVYTVQAADAGARGYSQVTEGGWDIANTTLTLSPAIASLTATDLYLLSLEHPDVLVNAINEVQRNDYEEFWFPLSVHIVKNDCNDMEASTLATDWDVTTGAAVATASTSIVYSGVQSLALACNATNEYAALETVLNVSEGQRFNAAIMCSVTQGDDAAFRIWNVTANTEIDSATSDEPAWMNLQPPAFTIPSGCEQIDVRLEGIASGDVTNWDQFQVWYDDAGVYPLPSYITSTAQLLDVVSVPQGDPGPGADEDWRTNEYGSRPLYWEWESKNPDSMRIKVRDSGEARPYLVTLRPRPELSSDTATTTMDKDSVVDLAADLILDPESGYKRLAAVREVALARTRPAPLIGRVGVRIG